MPLSSRQRRFSDFLLPLAAPLLTLALFLAFLPPNRYPLIYGDPDYGYFVSSLLLLRGQSPPWVDHPGTPVQSLGALVLLVWQTTLGQEQTVEKSFFLHSFEAHRTMVLTLLAFLLATQLWCGRALMRLSYPRTLIFLVPLAPLLFFETFAYLRRVSPETPLACVSLALVAVLARAQEPGFSKTSLWTPVAVGMLLGLAVSLKAVSLPLLILIFLLPSWSQRRLAFLSLVFFYLNLTVMIWSRFPFMLKWYESLLFHRGAYGQGSSELFSFAALSGNLGQIAEDFRFRGFLACLPALVLLVFPRGKDRRWPLFLTTFLLFFLVLKHPEPRYLTPFVAVLGLLFLRARALAPWPRAGLLISVLGASALLNYQPAFWAKEWLTQEAKASAALEDRLDREGCHVAVIGPVPLRVFALLSGDRASYFRVFGPSFEPLFPGYTFLNQGFALPSRPLDKAEWERIAFSAPCLTLVGRADSAPVVFRALFDEDPVPYDLVGGRYALYHFPKTALRQKSGLPGR